jgi:predicted Fe-S protein YdhL (DUF1289 family)
MVDKVLRSFCNACGRETDHDVVWSSSTSAEGPNGEVAETRIMAVKCRGCGDPAIREEQWYFDGMPDPETENILVSVNYKPARLWRRAPAWLSTLEQTEPDLKGLLDEVYSVTNDQQIRLLSMGVRSVLDHVMNRILGRDAGSFESKLEQMVERDHLTERQRENLAIVIDAGSASTHRSFRPPRELVEEMVTVMESVVREHYITGPMLNTAKTIIPPRPRPRRG